jgi:type II secretory pathway component PulM
MSLEERLVVMLAAGGVGVIVALAVIYVLTYRPTRDARDQVSTAWLDEQLRGRRE